MKTIRIILFLFLVLGVLTGCPFLMDSDDDTPGIPDEILAVTNLSSYNRNITLTFSGGGSGNIHAPQNTAGVKQRGDRSAYSVPEGRIIRKDYEPAVRFNANPPPISPEMMSPSRRLGGPSFVTYSVGNTKSFWVQDRNGNWVSGSATLRAQGEYSNVWVFNINYDNASAAKNDNKITTAQAQALAAKFDQIRPLAVNLLGYEYGGAPGETGGCDGDRRIQILAYDIDGDFSANQDGGTFGYFWGKDFYTNDELADHGITNIKSNYAEIFYVDANFMDKWPDMIYSTLVHEYQHMINFNQKAVKSGGAIVSESWYDEMLAMLAEDVISPLIGINPGSGGHPIDDRIPLFLDVYDEASVDDWADGSFESYSRAYGFGAYLIRNYGGPALIREMLFNNYVDHASITEAIRTTTGDPSLDFEKALERYAEALVYSSSYGDLTGKMTFDKTVQSTIKGVTYKAFGFDVWKIWADAWKHYGPYLYDPTHPTKPHRSFTIPAYSVTLYKIPDAWNSGYTVSVSPSYSDIKLTRLRK